MMVSRTTTGMMTTSMMKKSNSNARRWATSALPSSLTKSIFVKSLGHKSIVVRQAALQFLAKCLALPTKKRLDLAERERDCKPNQAAQKVQQ